MTDYGVRDDGFALKGLDVILAESFARARAVFGPDVDLTTTSPLRKILETVATEDAELWKKLEATYYGSFVSTSSGDSLDLLGADVGLARRESYAGGAVQLTLGGGVPGRTYLVGEGTVLVCSGVAGQSFTTDAPVRLTAAAPVATVGVTALVRGDGGNVGRRVIDGIDPANIGVYFADLGAATLTVTNPEPLIGGGAPEPDDAYRGRQLGVARNIWTLEAVRQAVLDLDGVLDVLLSDPLGGVDVSQSYFDGFDFGQRLFSAERRIGEPYRFDVVVAHEYRWPWRTLGVVPGVRERVSAAVDAIRPAGIHANIIEADHIDVGVRARVVLEPGYDGPAILARIADRLAADVGGLRLGGDVLSARVTGAFMAEPGVADVQALHLRRLPPVFGRITQGGVPFQSETVEAAVGANLVMGPTELAVFRPDSGLLDVTLVNP